MQVISRQVNEGLVIGDDVRLTILEVHEDHIRVGISSPNETPSYREEILYCQAASQSAAPVQELQMQ